MKKLFIRIFDKIGIFQIFNLVFKVSINKKSFRIPLIRRLGLNNMQLSEPWMIQLLEKVLIDKKDKVYVDVGVNTGQTLLKLKSVNSEIKYFGFEPNPTCVYYVKELVRINKFKNVTLFPVGISDKTSMYELSFYDEGDTDSGASMVADFRSSQKTNRKEYIACFRISDIVEKYDIPSIGILKVDVEGAEKEVIEAFRDRIIVDQPLIQLEILPVYNEKNKERLARQQALETFFRQINYTILRIHTNKDNQLTSLEEIATIGIHSNLEWCEYLIVPASNKDAIIKQF